MLKIISILFIPCLVFSQFKILHLSFHKGCIKEIERVCENFDFKLDSWDILSMRNKGFNGKTGNFRNYVMDHKLANLVFQKHKKTFEKYDLIITSDVAPLSRIFLQNNWEKPLLVWVCNRFDINVYGRNYCGFPDKEYLKLFANAANLPNVKVIGYTAYEKYHAEKKHGIYAIETIINPSGMNITQPGYKSIPKHINKKNSVFVRSYINENRVKLCSKLNALSINNYSGVYSGSRDLKEFKAMIHIPSVMSNLHLYENLNQEVVHFIPSQQFYKKLYASKKIIFYDWTETNKRAGNIPVEEVFAYCDWYREDLAPCFVFFNSYEDIPYLLQNTDFKEKKEYIRRWSDAHITKCLHQWKQAFSELLHTNL